MFSVACLFFPASKFSAQGTLGQAILGFLDHHRCPIAGCCNDRLSVFVKCERHMYFPAKPQPASQPVNREREARLLDQFALDAFREIIHSPELQAESTTLEITYFPGTHMRRSAPYLWIHGICIYCEQALHRPWESLLRGRRCRCMHERSQVFQERVKSLLAFLPQKDCVLIPLHFKSSWNHLLPRDRKDRMSLNRTARGLLQNETNLAGHSVKRILQRANTLFTSNSTLKSS